jgi:peptidoglycan/LPS O-acetylase OafA/YrhL
MYIVGTLFSIVYGIAVIHMLREPGLAHGRVILAIIPALLLLPNLAFQWAPSLFPLDIPAWSLFYEVVANVAFAFLTLRKASKTWFLVGICAASFVGMILLRDHGDECLNGGVIRTTAWLGLARVGFSFFCGVLLFRLTQHRAATLIKGARAYFGSIAIALLLCASLILSWWVTKSGIYEFIAVGLIFPSIVYFAAQLDVPQRVARICIFLGEISYPLYMIHSPLFTPLYGKVFVNAAQRYPILRLYLLPVYVLCLVILSWILARNYDAPVRRLLMQFYNRRLASSNG